jgi:hypothetical protein
MSSGPIRDTWAGLSLPSEEGVLTAAHVSRTNAWVFKDSKGGFGLMLTGVEAPLRLPPLRNIHITYRPEKLVEEGGRSRSVARCLEVSLDPSCEPEALATVLERLATLTPTGSFSTDALIQVIEDASELFMALPPESSKERVIGVWGELYVIAQLVGLAQNEIEQLDVLRAWEAEGGQRDIVDFRFPGSRTVLEVKSSVGRRVHHINGYGQLTVPSDFEHGLLASLLIRESSAGGGQTADDLVRHIEGMFRGSGPDLARLKETFSHKLVRRGRESRDERYRFTSTPESLELFEMKTIPRPVAPQAVSEVEWVASLEQTTAIAPAERNSILDALRAGRAF